MQFLNITVVTHNPIHSIVNSDPWQFLIYQYMYTFNDRISWFLPINVKTVLTLMHHIFIWSCCHVILICQVTHVHFILVQCSSVQVNILSPCNVQLLLLSMHYSTSFCIWTRKCTWFLFLSPCWYLIFSSYSWQFLDTEESYVVIYEVY